MFVWMIYPKSSLLKEVFFNYYSAFVAYEEGAPVDLNQEEIAKRNLEEYKSKLIVERVTLPDPLGIKKNSWIGEKDGMQTWPSVYIMDISKYFENVIDSSDLNPKQAGLFKI